MLKRLFGQKKPGGECLVGGAHAKTAVTHARAPDVDPVTTAADTSGIGEMIEMIDADLRRATLKLGAAGSEMRETIASSRSAVSNIGNETDRMAVDTGQALDSMRALASTINELSVSNGEISRQAQVSSELAAEAEGMASEAAASVQELRLAIDEIHAVVKLINDIASQTNLLALNATIEAARAGDMGRGFAVVAGEVKSLASETQRATGTIAATLSKLQSTAIKNLNAVNHIVGIAGRIRPVFAAVASSVEEQAHATEEIERTARSTAEFAKGVSEKARTIHSTTVEAGLLGETAEAASIRMNGSVADMTRQLMTVLRQTPQGDRRRDDRWPTQLGGYLTDSNKKIQIRTIDVSLGGLLVEYPQTDRPRIGTLVSLDLGHVGIIPTEVVAHSSAGVHLRFATRDRAALSGIIRLIDELKANALQDIERARSCAAKIMSAFDTAIASRDLSIDDLFDINYVPVPGTNPQQYETRALRALERILPPVQEAFLKETPSLVFAIAVDRNGYIPVHNATVSQPQRHNDVIWNTVNCRNKRIFDDRAGLLAARNSRPFLLQNYPRDLGGGTIVMMKEVDSPLTVQGRHWGGFRMAYRL